MRSYRRILILIIIYTKLIAAGGPVLEVTGEPYFTARILQDAVSGMDPMADHEKVISTILDLYVERSFPLAVITLDSISERSGSKTLYLNITANDYVRIDRLSFPGAVRTNESILKRICGITKGERFNEEKVKNAPLRLYRTGLFSKLPSYSIYRADGQYGIRLSVEERRFNEILLLGAYSGGEAKGEYSFSAGLRFDNIKGTMRKTAFAWNRSGSEKEDIYLSYTEPFLLTAPLSTAFEFAQKYRKDEMLKRYFSARQTYSPDLIFSLKYGFSSRSIFPGGRTNRGRKITETRYFGGIGRSDLFEAGMIPSVAGYGYELGFSSVEIVIADSLKSSGVEINADLKNSVKLRKDVFLVTAIRYEQIFMNKDLPELSRISFGGAASFRGYREDHFRSDVLIRQTADIIYVTPSGELAFSAFADACQYNFRSENAKKIKNLSALFSFGSGIIYERAAGVISVSAAVPAREGLQNSVLHVRYSVRF